MAVLLFFFRGGGGRVIGFIGFRDHYRRSLCFEAPNDFRTGFSDVGFRRFGSALYVFSV